MTPLISLAVQSCLGDVPEAARGNATWTLRDRIRGRARGRYAVAAERLARALGLWHGDAVLDDLPLPDYLRAETERLEQLRLGVLEAGFDARQLGLTHGESIDTHEIQAGLEQLDKLTRRGRVGRTTSA